MAEAKRGYDPLTAEQQEFMMQNLAVGHFHARRYVRRSSRLGDQPAEDVDQDVALAMARAVSSYSPGRAKITTWSAFQVRHAIQQGYRNSKLVKPPPWWADGTQGRRSESQVALARAAAGIRTGADVDEPSIAEEIAGPEAEEESGVFEMAQALLCPRWFEVIRRTFLMGQTMAQAAEAMGISKQRVQQLRVMAIAKLSESMDADEF